MSIMAKTPSGYKKIGSAYLGERPVDKVFNANGDVVYALQRELTGVPPLLFKGKEQSDLLNYRICGNTETKQRDYSGSSPLTVPVHDGELYNYRIYGNTVNGESVGEKTANLFDGVLNDNTGNHVNTGLPISHNGRVSTDLINTIGDTLILTYSGDDIVFLYSVFNGNTLIRRNAAKESGRLRSGDILDVSGGNSVYICFFKYSENQVVVISSSDISNIMLNSGSTPLPYEPYGYKVPIAVTNSGTTSNETIYLPEPIKMVGSEAEYVDFYSQKQYFADGTNTAVTIPALPISAGTNTVTVNTTVQPSSVEVSTDENVSVGDLVTSGQHAGEYKVDVTVEGKNLFDGEFSQGYWRYTDGVHGSGDPWWITSDKISCKGNTYYTFNSAYIGKYFGFTWFDANNNYLSSSYVDNINDAQIVNYTAISPNNANYLVINIKSGNNQYIYPTTITDLMLNAGSTPLPYEPYHAPVTTPIYLPEPIKMVGSEAEYVDYAEQKQHRVRKNLLQNTATSQTINGVTFTVNNDGSVTCNGTSTSQYYSLFRIPCHLVAGNYTISGCPVGGGSGKYRADIRISPNGNMVGGDADIGAGTTMPIDESGWYDYTIRIQGGYTVDDLTFKPMIRKADIEDDTYEPYIEDTDLDVTLPALPTIKGTNEMSVDTDVQPSRMDIEGRIKTLT